MLSFSTLILALALADSTPRTGRDVLRVMHDAYQGKWYRTLTFTQKTTVRRPDGKDTVTTWYESLRYSPRRFDWGGSPDLQIRLPNTR